LILPPLHQQAEKAVLHGIVARHIDAVAEANEIELPGDFWPAIVRAGHPKSSQP
jgi:hypothetical protein